jgi:hypothetical protein
MSDNRRIYYACQKVGIAPLGSANYSVIHGLQSVGMTTNFNLEQAFEIGQLEIYDNMEGIPNIEVTLQKNLDGYPPIYCLATIAGSTAGTLVGRSNGRCDLGLAIFPDTNTYAGSGGGSAVVNAVDVSGLYPSSVRYTLPTTGACTEDVTLVGNNKRWLSSPSSMSFTTDITGADSPLSIAGSGGIARREDVIFGVSGCVLPGNLPGVTQWGASSGYNNFDGSNFGVHISNIRTGTDLGRTEMFEVGRFGVYNRFVNFPTEVTTEITIIAISGDMVDAVEDVSVGGCSSVSNTTNQAMMFKLCEGLHIDLGTKNRLKSVSEGGGNATGGNVELTYTYSNFNDFAVYHYNDPSHYVPNGGW